MIENVTAVQAPLGHRVCPALVGRERELDAVAALARASRPGAASS
jgi:hypothetical protein